MNDTFARLARWVEHAAGSPIAFALAALTVGIWGATGPLFGWSDTWQLVINTGTTIVTFLMDMSGRAVIEDGAIVIRVPIANLPAVVEGSWAAGGMDTRFKVTDPEAFAKDLVIELNDENEIGTTRVHKMFDKAIEGAINWGAEGIEEHEEQEA